MNQKNAFGEGILFGVTNHIYALFMTNIYFMLSNIICLFFFMTLEPAFSNITIYFLALIPTGPTISALFYSIGKLIREKELSPLNDFFHGYKINFKDTMKFWLPLLVVLYILIVDLHYFNSNLSTINNVLSVVFLIGIILIMIISINAFLISAGYKFRLKDIWKLSVYYSFMKVKITFGNISIVIITLFLLLITSNFLILFIASLICYAFMLNSKGLLEDIQLRFCDSQKSPS
ncbi:YesL family protein [Neobacillus sp. YX16]|uniref:YesL family protein n=1 Tax=Neobacillus sp. YX16 TaxID=3047874 RepID=UPI0024C3988C|nr:YesL family protein [Neobacillus sp. YX16]WHZ03209.1 YesL family protein [Neobacillus sp. YX16]